MQEKETFKVANIGRLEAAAHLMRAFPVNWIYDAKVFFAEVEGHPDRVIANTVGFLAFRNQRPAFRLNALVSGVAIVQPVMMRNAMGKPEKYPADLPMNARWLTHTVSSTEGRAETFGWNAVCEYFNIGMWDARRVFGGYADPNPETIERARDRIDNFVIYSQVAQKQANGA